MADNKQPRLNGAYYSGPSILPAEPPRRHNRRRCCCFYWELPLGIIIFLVLVLLILWIVVQPRGFRFHVSDAKLTQFNLTHNNDNNVSTLHYNLVLNFTARNPNRKLDIYYDKAEGHVSYRGVRFASADVVTRRNAFRQHTKSTDSSMSGVFTGQHVMVLDPEQVNGFEEQRSRVYSIGVTVSFTIRFRLGDFVGTDTKARAKCELRIPLSSKAAKTTTTTFQSTRCGVKF